eukprot:scaffold18187_cov87-Skeletonema_marinoi.AAC.2
MANYYGSPQDVNCHIHSVRYYMVQTTRIPSVSHQVTFEIAVGDADIRYLNSHILGNDVLPLLSFLPFACMLHAHSEVYELTKQLKHNTSTATMKHSHIGEAAIKELEANHSEYKDELWASTTGKVVGDIQHSPKGMWDQLNDVDNGMFLEKIKASIAVLAEKSEKSGNKIV